jgi:hypothetical protein
VGVRVLSSMSEQHPAVNVDSLPDPGPSATRDVRAAIDRSGLPCGQIADVINRACRITWVSPELVERWREGQDWPIYPHAMVLFWLGGVLAVGQMLVGLSVVQPSAPP